MNTVKIKKTKLITKLQQNRNEHALIYEEALHNWQGEVTYALTVALDKAMSDDDFITNIELDKPENHIGEYNEIIERVTWHEDTIIELSLVEFNHFVRDCWDWMPNFLNQAFHYSSNSSTASRSTESLINQKMDNFE
jgi:hypothetical protein